MKVLLIDTCTSHLLIALVENNIVKASYHELLKEELSKKALSVLETLFHEINWNPSDIDTILVANGPGSFTGIRIGVTIAKTYAWAFQKKIVPISSLAVLSSATDTISVAMIDARRDSVYAGIYDSDLNSLKEDQYIEIQELKKEMSKYCDCECFSYDEFEHIKTKKPNLDIVKIVKKYQNMEGVNPHQLNPEYLKLTEAEMKRRENDNNII